MIDLEQHWNGLAVFVENLEDEVLLMILMMNILMMMIHYRYYYHLWLLAVHLA